MADLESKLIPLLEQLLEPGETLAGACVASQVKTFKGGMVAIGVTENRLIVQPLTRKFEPDGDALSLPPERIADVSADGAGGGWVNASAAIMDNAAVTLKLKTTDGEKLKLMMMRGTGPLGGLGGGEVQRQGVDALAAWFSSHELSEILRRRLRWSARFRARWQRSDRSTRSTTTSPPSRRSKTWSRLPTT